MRIFGCIEIEWIQFNSYESCYHISVVTGCYYSGSHKEDYRKWKEGDGAEWGFNGEQSIPVWFLLH